MLFKELLFKHHTPCAEDRFIDKWGVDVSRSGLFCGLKWLAIMNVTLVVDCGQGNQSRTPDNNVEIILFLTWPKCLLITFHRDWMSRFLLNLLCSISC